MGKIIKAVAKAVVKTTADVVAVADPNAGRAIASQAEAIGNGAQLLTAQASNALSTAATATGNALSTAAKATGNWVVQGVSKDGAITNFVQDYVPAGGFITAIAHAAAGNEEYAQYAAVKGVSTTVVTVAAVAGSLGGPAGAILAGGLAGAAVSAWEGGMKTVLDPSVKGKLQDLSVQNVLVSGAIGAAGAAVGVGVGKLAGAAGKSFSARFGKGMTTEVGTVVSFTRQRAGAVVGNKLNPVVPLWQFMTPGQKLAAGGTLAGKQILKGAGVGGLKEIAVATGLTAAGLKLLGKGTPPKPAGPTPPIVTVAEEDDKSNKKKVAVLVGTAVIIGCGGIILGNLGDGGASTKPAATAQQTTVAVTSTAAATTVVTTVLTTVPPTTVVATTAAPVVVATNPAPATTVKKKPAATTTTAPATTLPPPLGAPTGVSATLTNPESCIFSVSFSPPADNGGSEITGYSVSGDASNTGSSSPIVVYAVSKGGGATYTFNVRAINANGPGPAETVSVSADCMGSPPGG